MAKKRKRPAPSQTEIWDDTALVRSWNEAVEEYEFYHSIAARGEDVEEVLRKAEREDEGEEGADGGDGENGIAGNGVGVKEDEVEMEDGEVEDGEVEEGDVEDDEVPVQELGDAGSEMIGPQLPREFGKTVPGLEENQQDRPEASGSSAAVGEDQVLENIKMAYWWAGYYSGLHDGQQKAKQGKT